jgi:ABC-type antimicrobial peptide transport system permease subunit
MITHPLRSLLTALGVFIGVASVVWLLAIGEGIASRAESEIRALGADNIIVSSDRPPEEERKSRGKYFYSYGLTEKDLDKILKTVPGIIAAYPSREHNNRHVFTKHGETRAELLGCLPNFRKLHDLRVTKGRFLTEEDNHRMAEHCVLSAGVSRKLFPFGDCLGKSVSVYGNLYEVVGEVGKRANFEDNKRIGFREEFQDNIYLPIETVWAKVFDYYYRGYDGSNMYSKVTLTLEDEGKEKIFAAAKMIKSMLKQDHGMEDFKIAVPIELMEQAENARLTFVGLMGIVAAISLIVGGIGIMNVMLATVTERTREIGIRRALGARKRDITLQFLVEAIALTTVGGLLGILAGFLCEPVYGLLLSNLETFAPTTYESLPDAMKDMTPVIVFWSLPFVFLIAVTIGIVFGLYPARKAAAMNPVDALRHIA